MLIRWYENGKKVLFSDETKINMVNSDGKRYVRHPVNSAFNYKYTRSIIKHGGGNIKVWGCFSGCGADPFGRLKVQRINGNTKIS